MTGKGWELETNSCRYCPEGTDRCGRHHQSPIDLERNRAVEEALEYNECIDLHWMKYEDSSCTWEQLEGEKAFSIERHALKMSQPLEPGNDGEGSIKIGCNSGDGRRFGRIDFSKGFSDWWFLSHIDFKVPSEHTQEGKRYSAEVQMAHFYSITGEAAGVDNEMATVAIFLEAYEDSPPYPYLDRLICEWRKVEDKTREQCGLDTVDPYPGCFNPGRGHTPFPTTTTTESPKAPPQDGTDSQPGPPTQNPTPGPTPEPSPRPTNRPPPTPLPTRPPPTQNPTPLPTPEPSSTPTNRPPPTPLPTAPVTPEPTLAPILAPVTGAPVIAPTTPNSTLPENECYVFLLASDSNGDDQLDEDEYATFVELVEPGSFDGLPYSQLHVRLQLNFINLLGASDGFIDIAGLPTPNAEQADFLENQVCDNTSKAIAVALSATLTDSPQTPAPGTEAPVTEAPLVVTEPPATEAPLVVTESPATEAPLVVTESPATEAPLVVTESPATEAPLVVTEPPATEAPLVVTEPPATEAPLVVTEPPATEAPLVVTEPPVAPQGNLTSPGNRDRKLLRRSVNDLIKDNAGRPADAKARVVLDPDNFRPPERSEAEWAEWIEAYSAHERGVASEGQRKLLENDHLSYHSYQFLIDCKTEYYFRYQGTQTVPPCYGPFEVGSRGNTNHWRVLKDPVRVHPRQIAEMERLLRERIAPQDAKFKACENDTAGKIEKDGRISVARPLMQFNDQTHAKTFCECDDWASKWPEDRAWCKLERGDKDIRLYDHPYNFDSEESF